MNEEKPTFIVVTCGKWDEVDMVIAKGLEDGYCAIASAIGVMLVLGKERAIDAFNTMLHTYIAHLAERGNEGVVPVMTARSPGGLESIAYAINTQQAGYLFGVSEHEYMALPSSKGFVPRNKMLN